MSKDFIKGVVATTLGLALVATVATSVASASSDNSNIYQARFSAEEERGSRQMGMNNPAREAIKAALENGSYEEWQAAAEGTPMAEQINADNFDQLVKMHQLMQDGDFEGAKAIREELGLTMDRGKRIEKEEMNVNREAIKSALDNNSYEEWQIAAEGTPMAEQINADNFSRLVEAHQLMEEARTKMEAAKAIHQELGLEMNRGQHQGQGQKGFGQRAPQNR